MEAYDVLVDGQAMLHEGRQVTISAFTRKNAKHRAKARYGDNVLVVPQGTAAETVRRLRAAAEEAARAEQQAAKIRETQEAMRSAAARQTEAEQALLKEAEAEEARKRVARSLREDARRKKQMQDQRRPQRKAA